MQNKNNFDGLRLIGALLVLFSHQFALSGRWEPRFVPNHSVGNLGVLIFFSISGYLVSMSWARDPTATRFAFKRFLRIAPGLFIAYVFSYGLIDYLGLLNFPGNQYHQLNGSLWTIPLEIWCYVLLLGIGLVAKARSIPWVFFGALLVIRAVSDFRSTSYFLSYFGLFFAFGIALSHYPILRTWKAMAGFATAGIMLILAGHTILGLALIVPGLVIEIGTRAWPVMKDAGRFGDLSYGIYIYAWPVQQLMTHWLGPQSSYISLFAPSLAVTLALAYASWHLIEQPALRLKPSGRLCRSTAG